MKTYLNLIVKELASPKSNCLLHYTAIDSIYFSFGEDITDNTWKDLLNLLPQRYNTNETLKEYWHWKKDNTKTTILVNKRERQELLTSQAKSARGGFIGGAFSHKKEYSIYERRVSKKSKDMLSVQMMCFDIDGVSYDVLKKIHTNLCTLGIAAVLYSTPSNLTDKESITLLDANLVKKDHMKRGFRFGVVIAFDKPFDITNEKSREIFIDSAKKLAFLIHKDRNIFNYNKNSKDIVFAPQSLTPPHIMFLPTCCKDADFCTYKYGNKILSIENMIKFACAHAKLFPSCIKDKEIQPKQPKKKTTSSPTPISQEKKSETKTINNKFHKDPRLLPFYIGAFNRVFSINNVLDCSLNTTYTKNNKQTYTLKTANSSGGLKIYDDGLFAYSNHLNKDPLADGHEHCAFDVARVAWFGYLDKGTSPFLQKKELPSFHTLLNLCKNISLVKNEFWRWKDEQTQTVDSPFNFNKQSMTLEEVITKNYEKEEQQPIPELTYSKSDWKYISSDCDNPWECAS